MHGRQLTKWRLLAAYRMLSTAFHRAGAGLCLVGPDDRIVVANSLWLRAAGLAPERAAGTEVLRLFPDLRDPVAQAKAGDTVEFRRRIRHSDGREVCWTGSVAPVPVGRRVGTLITARDITDPSDEGSGEVIGPSRGRARPRRSAMSLRRLVRDLKERIRAPGG